MKVDSYINSKIIEKIDPLEEIALLTVCLAEETKNKKEILTKICKLIKYDELFESGRFNLFKILIDMEMDNLISKEEKEEIENELNMNLKEKIVMSPQVMEDINRAINQVNTEEFRLKVEQEAEQKAEQLAEQKAERLAEQKAEQIAEQKVQQIVEQIVEEEMVKIIKNFKGYLSSEKIAKILNLDVGYVDKL